MGKPNIKLKAWRLERGYSMEEAAALVVVEGKRSDKATWHGWESKGKLPKPPFMAALERLTGLEPNDFYSRPDGAAAPQPPAQAALAL